MNIRNVLYFLSMAVILVLGFSEDGISIQGDTERLSAYSVFIEENGDSYDTSISSDGHDVAFSSDAVNLVAVDTNGARDIFVRDRNTGQTARVSVSSTGTEGNGDSDNPSISSDGRYVTFGSYADNLVTGDTNIVPDIFVYDRYTGQTTRVSISSMGVEGNAISLSPSISSDGRYVAFASAANNLAIPDSNGFTDIFVRDGTTGQTTRVSVDSSGTEGNGHSLSPVISADGRYVAFKSGADNLVTGDANGVMDVFVHDRTTVQTTRVSVSSTGTEGNGDSDNPSISSDGRYVAFHSQADNLVPGDANLFPDIFVHDRTSGQTTRVSVDSFGSEGNSGSFYPTISSGGRYVAFESYAVNLVIGDANGVMDVFVHDRTTGQTTRASLDSFGSEGNNESRNPAISSDGSYVAFISDANNLITDDTNSATDVFVHDRTTAQTTRESLGTTSIGGNHESFAAAVSFDGRYVAFHSDADNLITGDGNGRTDVFVHDRGTWQITRVSVDGAGVEGNNNSQYPSISSDGRYVAFGSAASNLVGGDTNGKIDIFIHDRDTGLTTRVSVTSTGTQSNGGSYFPSISGDARYVAFHSDASNLVTGDTNGVIDVFVHDRNTGQTTRVSVDSAGVEGNLTSWYPSISADGRYVAFESYANNLVIDDTNFRWDIFVHDRNTGQTNRVSVDSGGIEGNKDSNNPSISADGRYVAFQSDADNLVTGDTNWSSDVFVHDRTTGQITRASVDSAGVEGNAPSEYPSISSDGSYVAFATSASNLVPDDTNGKWDVFVHDRSTGQTTRASVSSDGIEGNDTSWIPSISADGRYVAFESYANNLVPDDTNGRWDVFIHDYLGFTVSEPVPDIKANGSDGPLTITRSDILSVTVELDSGDYFGDDADWWLVARTPLGWYYYHPISGWLPGRDVTLQIPLRDLPSIEVFNMSGLPTGDYTFYFGVDLVQNGLINLAQAYYDQVSVTINP